MLGQGRRDVGLQLLLGGPAGAVRGVAQVAAGDEHDLPGTTGAGSRRVGMA